MPEDDPATAPLRSRHGHPAPLNVLAEIFDRRNIAVGIDSSGQVVLARPDSLLAGVEMPSNGNRSRATSSATTRNRRAGSASRATEKLLPFVTVRLRGVERAQINGEGSLDVHRCSAGDS